MKRAVICVDNPHELIDQLDDYSIMVVNPNSSPDRLDYLFSNSDYSLKITQQGHEHRSGGDYDNERLFWYTSGTTGDSKFCSFTQIQLDNMARTICKSYDLDKNDRYVGIMPLWHVHGQGFYWATRMVDCERHFLPVSDIRQVVTFHPTFVTAVPHVLKTLAKSDFDTWRFIRSASSALPDPLYCELKDKFHVPVIEAFGMTEALSHCFTNPLHGEQRVGTVGLPDGIEADIVDGQLYIQGLSMFQPGWYNTGDLALRDEAGYYKIIGRHRDQINVKGKKLNPESLETQLMKNIPGLTDCVVFGSDSVKCFYMGDCDADQIRKFLLDLGPHCRPMVLQAVDQIPVSPSGKVSRSWLENNYKNV